MTKIEVVGSVVLVTGDIWELRRIVRPDGTETYTEHWTVKG